MIRAHRNPHSSRAKSHLLLAIALSTLVFLASACSADYPDRLWLPADGWSRALAVGRSSTATEIALLVESERAIALLPGATSDQTASLLSIPFANPDQFETHPIPVLRGRTIRGGSLLSTGAEYRLYWIENRTVYWSSWVRDPAQATQPRGVNIAGGAADYAVAAGPDGDVSLWIAGTEDHPGLYVISIDGTSPEQPIIDPNGDRPDLASAEGGFHAVWLQPPPGAGQAKIMYSFLARDSNTPSSPVEIATRTLSNTDVYSGPWIGVQGDYAFVFFTVEIKSGLRAGEIDTTVHIFPISDPTAVRRLGNRIHIQSAPIAVSDDPADPASRAPGLDPWEPAIESGTAALTQLAPDEHPGARLAVALKADLFNPRRQRQSQIAVLYFQDGNSIGTEVVTFTPAPSTRPVIQSDPDGNPHLLWLERAEQEGQVVYYASSHPQVVRSLRGITSDDLGRLTAETLFAALSGLLFSPLALLWLILPIVVIVASSFLRQEGEAITARGSLVSIAAAVASYWTIKLLVIPGLFATTPFVSWYPVMPAWLAQTLRLLVPLTVSALGLLVAWLFTYRRGRHSPLFFILLFGLLDGALSMAIYAESLIGGF